MIQPSPDSGRCPPDHWERAGKSPGTDCSVEPADVCVVTEVLSGGDDQDGLESRDCGWVRQGSRGKESHRRISEHVSQPDSHAVLRCNSVATTPLDREERADERCREEKRRGVDADENLRSREGKDECADGGRDQDARALDCGVGTLHPAEPVRWSDTGDQRSETRLRRRSDQLRRDHCHVDRPRDLLLREDDDRGREDRLEDAA